MDLKIKLFNYDYSLTISKGYCGALMHCKHREGGRDLRDGSLNDLPRILWDIVACELSLGRWSNNEQIAEKLNSFLNREK